MARACPARAGALTLRSTQRPLLLIQGAHDEGINGALATTLAALDAAHDARVVPLADAGHFANMEQPERFGAILRDILNDVEGRRSQPDLEPAAAERA